MLQLKGYQERCLEDLEAYLALVNQRGANEAFYSRTGRAYRAVEQLPELPYVCLRIPTGGGKTLMACHALGIATKTYRQTDRALCLWLVPSNTIRDQTLKALRDRQHPYRQAVDSAFAGQVRVMDLSEALYIQRGILEGDTVIVVSTLQALRVQDTEGRKIYEAAGVLKPIFDALDASLRAKLECYENGEVIPSLANVLKLWRPLVIMDEAHNARTELSFDTLARIGPSCVLEFTATPETTHKPEQKHFASNVLCHVSAWELKSEDMVKLPIKLRTRSDWKEVVADAVQMQRTLEEAAKEEEQETQEYLRPIVLLQAQPHSRERQTLNVEVVKQSLQEDFKIPENEIAIATGQTRGIDDVDLSDRACPLRFIITVQALKEGWDCPFAYVLCSVAEIGSTRAVEQIMGRVLRLPQAHRKSRQELNCAYAFAASPRFAEAANALVDALIENGFEKMEAKDLVIPPEQADLPLSAGPLFETHSAPVSEPPDFSLMDEPVRAKVSFDRATSILSVTGRLSEAEMKVVQGCFTNAGDRAKVEQIYQRALAQAGASAPRTRPLFAVPLLGIRIDGQLEPFDDSYFKEAEWRLADCDATLAEAEFPTQEASAQEVVLDVGETGKVEVNFVQQLHEQLMLLSGEQGWTVASLVNWLDFQIRHVDIARSQSALFIHYAVTNLMESRKVTIEQLARRKFGLRDAIAAKIEKHRQSEASKGYSALLFGEGSTKLEVSPKLNFYFDENRYYPKWRYQGSFTFSKHYFPNVGELESTGEEFECARFIDTQNAVWYWVRNIERRQQFSFWLQTSTDKFYPDFLVLLHDGRILVVEYKGTDRWSDDDSKEKRALGELWAERSGGHCLFLMPKGPDWPVIMAAINRASNRSNEKHNSLF
ncbi:MAG: DEAD/DEAH box helicase family protein [Terriglobia bacterium]